ncbi:Uncharacterised protein [Shigella sonnei]|nr:Uncharacterised protein [Shigella sonnei]
MALIIFSRFTSRSPPSRTSPIATASSTVVMPLATISASWLLIAEWAGQSTFGRGVKNLSRLSVCSSISPGSSQPPSPSIASGRRLWLSAKARISPSCTSSEPCTTSFSSTNLTLLIIMKRLPLGAGGRQRHYVRLRRGRCRRWPRHGLWLRESARLRRRCFWRPARR